MHQSILHYISLHYVHTALLYDKLSLNNSVIQKGKIMPDIASIGAALASIKTATEIAKLIKDSGASLEKAEVKLQIANLISSLADAKIELAELQTEMNQLKDKLNQKILLKWTKPYYMMQTDLGQEGPFCPTCYDNNEKVIRLQGSGPIGWSCLTCKGFFTDSEYVKPQPVRLTR